MTRNQQTKNPRRIVIREGAPSDTPIKKRHAISRCGLRIFGSREGIEAIKQALSSNITPPRILTVYRNMGQWRCNTNYGGKQVIRMAKEKKVIDKVCKELNKENQAYFNQCVSKLLRICRHYDMRVCHYLRYDYSGYYKHELWST